MVVSTQQGALQPGKAELCLILQPPGEERELLWAPTELRWLPQSGIFPQLLSRWKVQAAIKTLKSMDWNILSRNKETPFLSAKKLKPFL